MSDGQLTPTAEYLQNLDVWLAGRSQGWVTKAEYCVAEILDDSSQLVEEYLLRGLTLFRERFTCTISHLP